MRRSISAARVCGVVALVALIVVGCTSDGLSYREVRGQDYASYVYSITDPSAQKTIGSDARGGAATGALGVTSTDATPAKPLTTPAKIAVAQLGEVAPPDYMMDKLRKDTGAFAMVQPASGVVDVTPSANTQQKPQDHSAQQNAQAHAERMRRYARDVGADYLFLYGGTLDRAQTSTSWSALNLTIIGAFVIPSQRLDATATAAGSLIDVQSGKVVLSVSATQHEAKMASSVGVESREIKLLHDMREVVLDKLATQLSERIKERATASKAVGG